MPRLEPMIFEQCVKLTVMSGYENLQAEIKPLGDQRINGVDVIGIEAGNGIIDKHDGLA